MQLGKAKTVVLGLLISSIHFEFSIHIYLHYFFFFWLTMLNGRQRHFSSFFFQRKRLEGRGTETKESLQKRLDSAQEALEYGRVLFSVF